MAAFHAPVHPNNHCPTQQEFQQFSSKVWSPKHWQRPSPKPSTITAAQKAINCPQHRKGLERIWSTSRQRFYAYRGFRQRNPYYGCTSHSGCGYYALPAYVVECESSGRFNDPSAPNGGYSLLDGPRQGVPTWETWRPSWASGYAEPYEAPRRAQDEATQALYHAHGLEPWECA